MSFYKAKDLFEKATIAHKEKLEEELLRVAENGGFYHIVPMRMLNDNLMSELLTLGYKVKPDINQNYRISWENFE